MQKPMRVVGGVAGVLGRVLLCTVFLAAAAGYAVPDAHKLAELLAVKGSLAPAWALGAAITLIVVGCFSVVVGYKARLGASTLLVFLILATYYFHGFTFRTLVNDQVRQEHMLCLLTNLSIMGAMLFIVANGAGRMSLDRR